MSSPMPSRSGFDSAIDHLRDRLGWSIPPDRRGEIEKRISRIISARGGGDPGRLLRALHTDETMFEALVDEVTVGETYFFRDPASFELIRKTILPDLDRNRPAGAPIHIWSAGCATGEEAYSLAILLEEEGWAAERAHILATDISQDALRKARAAVYAPWALRGDDSGQLAERYFVREAGRYRLAERFRSRVSFRYLNLASAFRPSLKDGLTRMDLILCRNVLIYLDGATTQAVARRLFDCLADGGWLLTGPSDPPLWPYAPFKTVLTAAGVLYRREGQASRQPVAKTRGAPNALHQRPAVQPRTALRPHATDILSSAAPIARQTVRPDDQDMDLGLIRTLADQGRIAAARQAAEEAIRRAPLLVEPRYLLATLALADGRVDEAVTSLRQLLYIDPDLTAAHMMLGTALLSKGEVAAARRAFAIAFALSAQRPEHEIVPLTDGETAGDLARAAKRQFDWLLPSLEVAT